MKIPFKKANILLPKDADMHKWSVVACDQYTSEPEYWNSVREIVGSNPSTLNLTLPEIYLEESDVEERIKKINQNMEELVNMDFFNEYSDSMIYLERTQEDGKVREGLMGIVDLEDYSYEKGSQTLIRATEKTVIERIPPRVKVRENALLELPHIMILIDDEKKNVIETFFFFCNFAFAVNNLTSNVSRGLPQLCKLPCINMQQNAGGQSDKINAKVKILLANTFLTHCFFVVCTATRQKTETI